MQNSSKKKRDREQALTLGVDATNSTSVRIVALDIQREVVYRALRSLGEDPMSLPVTEPGMKGTRALVWELVRSKACFPSRISFQKVWQQLRGSGELKDAEHRSVMAPHGTGMSKWHIE